LGKCSRDRVIAETVCKNVNALCTGMRRYRPEKLLEVRTGVVRVGQIWNVCRLSPVGGPTENEHYTAEAEVVSDLCGSERGLFEGYIEAVYENQDFAGLTLQSTSSKVGEESPSCYLPCLSK
jgi:hypothetical protein